MLTRLRTSVLILVLIGLCGPTTFSRTPQSAGAYAPVGHQATRGYFSNLPFESIDMVNGNLALTFTDLVLPGSAGMDVRITRRYRHQTEGGFDAASWTVSFTDVPIVVRVPVVPSPHSLELVMGDRTIRPLHGGIVNPYYITTDFWRYDSVERKLYLPDGRVAGYQPGSDPFSSLMLQYVEDAFGNRINAYWQPWAPGLLYEVDYIQQIIHSSSGQQTRTVEFSGNLLSSISVEYGGRTWTYAGNSTQFPVGPPLQFSAPNPGSLTVTLPTGGTVTYTFVDENGRSRVQSVTTGGRAIASGTWQFNFTEDGLRVGTVTTPTGRQLTFKHETYLGPEAANWILKERTLSQGGSSSSAQLTYEDVAFGAAGVLKALSSQVITQDGVTYTTQLEYNGVNFKDFLRPWRITETASNHSTARVTTRTFDYGFNTYWMINKVGSQTVRIGAESFTSSTEYDDVTGFPTSHTSLGIAAQFGPDGGGNVGSATDPSGHQVSSAFQWGVPATVTTPESSVQRQINQDGSVASETRGGATTSYSYDALGRLTTVAPPEGATSTTTYDPDGFTVTVSRGSSAVTTTLDGFGRPISTLNAEGVRTYTEYDSEGRMTFQSYPYAGGGPPGNAFSYDFLGRVSRVTHSVDGRFYWYYYAGCCVVRIDENGHQTTQYLEAFGRPENAQVTTVHDGSQYWSYSYNALGSLTRVDAPQGPDRVWVYNGQNQLVSETQPESGTTTFSYRADGLVQTRTTAQGTTSYTYDGDHRLTGIDAPGTADDTTLSYDSRGNRTLAILGNGNETRFVYDAANRLLSREERVNGQIFTTGFAYDARDNLTAITYPSLRTVQYEYDAANRITRVFSGSQTYADLITYHPSGARSSMRFGNGTTETLELDDRQRPYHLVTGAAADPVDLTYGYDWAGNVTSILDPRSGKSAWYQYDGLDRLTNVTGFGANTFTYDALGNRLTKGAPAVTYTYDPDTNRLSAATSAPGPDQGVFQYDAVGNMTSDGVGGTYTYSPRSTMTSATLNGATTQYTYDADGLRIQKSSATGQQYFVRGLGGQLLAEYAALFTKTAPASGTTGSNSTVTLQWTPVVGASAYAYCVHTVNNNCSGVSWTWNGSATSKTLTNLAPGTYYWQAFALTASGWKEADNSTWWSFTITEGGFMKLGPVNGIGGLSTVTLQWAAVPGDPSYSFCFDTTNNNSCDTFWWPNGGATSVYWDNLAPGTYYWQARVQIPSGQIFDADSGAWWSFTIGSGGGGGFGKQTPAPGISGLPSTFWTQWTPVPNEGYWICWDTTNNNTCDTMWWPNGGSTSKLLENLAPGTYYWQVKTADVEMYADSGQWWPFTVGAPPVTFNKQTPAAGAVITANATTLWWDPAPGGQYYEVCIDTVNNGTCDTSWQLNGLPTYRLLTGLTDGTYYWQVRAQTASGPVGANNEAWWSFTIDAPDPIREYIYFGGELLASLTLTTATPVSNYYHTDVLGSVRGVTSATGAPLTRHDYSAFGESNSSLQGDPRRFTGKERDAESAFDYFDARYYRNVWGRFVSADDSVFMDPFNPQSMNRYAYVLNNPLRWVDPSGHQQEPINRGWTDSSTVVGKLPGPVPFIDPTISLRWLVDELLTLRDGLRALPERLLEWSNPDIAAHRRGEITQEQYNYRFYVRQRTAMVPAFGTLTAPSFTSALGRLVPIPRGWVGKVSDTGKGIVFQKPGSAGNANMIRIMDPNAQNPEGYVVIYNRFGQAVDIFGKPTDIAGSHIPLNVVGNIRWPW